MIKYFRELKHLKDDDSFKLIKKRLNKFEIIILTLFSIVLATLLIWSIFLTYFQARYKWIYVGQEDKLEISEDIKCKNLKIVNIVFYIIFFFPMTLFITFQCMRYATLTKMMKNNLHYFYTKTKNNIKMLFIANTIYFGITMISGSLILAFFINPRFISHKENFTTLERVIWVIVDWFQYIIILSFGYLIHKDIDFKLYVTAIMYGHRMSNKLKDISLFIIKLPTNSRNLSYETTIDEDLIKESSRTIKRNMVSYERETMMSPAQM